jgi:predicted nucleic acid-binding protein
VRFVDTNVLLYAISRDRAEHRKSARANEIVDGGDIGLSVQVLQEFYVQSTRATRSDAITHEQAAGLMESWARFPVQVTTAEVMRAALATRHRFGISYWDAAIIEAGRALGCTVVLSEDLDTATDYDGVRVEDPFAAEQTTTARSRRRAG